MHTRSGICDGWMVESSQANDEKTDTFFGHPISLSAGTWSLFTYPANTSPPTYSHCHFVDSHEYIHANLHTYADFHRDSDQHPNTDHHTHTYRYRYTHHYCHTDLRFSCRGGEYPGALPVWPFQSLPACSRSIPRRQGHSSRTL